jgi:hypothetical protein
MVIVLLSQNLPGSRKPLQADVLCRHDTKVVGIRGCAAGNELGTLMMTSILSKFTENVMHSDIGLQTKIFQLSCINSNVLIVLPKFR